MDQIELIRIVCSHPPGHRDRQKALSTIIQQITPKLWKDPDLDYPDALQKTWEYFLKNLCSQYDATKASLATWLNTHLKWRIHDVKVTRSKEDKRKKPPSITDEGDIIDSIDNLPDDRSEPSDDLLTALQIWVETDADGELSRVHIRDRPDLTAQVLILRRLPPETGWKELSAEFSVVSPVAISTLSTFYQRKCLPLLRKFGESER